MALRRHKLLLVKAGDTLEDVKSSYGDFDAMFLHHLGELAIDPVVVQAHKGERLPPARDIEAAIITGSPHSVTAREPWAEDLALWAADVVSHERFVLGVCYGHQLLAHANGGKVVQNPNGYEVGTITVELTGDGVSDRLLGVVSGGARSMDFHSTHQDAVVELPRGARVLASTRATPFQAFALGERAWGVQFHPEFTESVMRIYIQRRLPLIRTDAERRGADPQAEIDRVQESVRATPHGRLLLRRFIACAFSGRTPRSNVG